MSFDWNNFKLDVPSTKDYEISGRVTNETEGKKVKKKKDKKERLSRLKLLRRIVLFKYVKPTGS